MVFTGLTPVRGNQAGIKTCLITQLGLVSTHLILRRQDNPMELFLTPTSHDTPTAVPPCGGIIVIVKHGSTSHRPASSA